MIHIRIIYSIFRGKPRPIGFTNPERASMDCRALQRSPLEYVPRSSSEHADHSHHAAHNGTSNERRGPAIEPVVQQANDRRCGSSEQISDELRHRGEPRRLVRIRRAHADKGKSKDENGTGATAEGDRPNNRRLRKHDKAKDREPGRDRKPEGQRTLIAKATDDRAEKQARSGSRELRNAMKRPRCSSRISSISQDRRQPCDHCVVDHRVTAEE